MTPQLTDEPQTVVVAEESVEYEFEKIDDSTVRFRFARETHGPEDTRNDDIDREDIPQAVLDELHTNGYTHE